jgi:hypothetical protein
MECPDDPREGDCYPDKLICFHHKYTLGDEHDYVDAMAMLLDILSEAPKEVLQPIFDEMKKLTEVEPDCDMYESIFDFYYGCTPTDVFREAAEKVAVMLPVFLFDHSGLTISTTSTRFAAADSAGWDWGQIGFIFMSHEDVFKDTGYASDEEKASGVLTEETIEKVRQGLTSIVETYSKYVEGDVWGFVVEKAEVCNKDHVHWEHEDSCWQFFGTEWDNGLADHIPEDQHELLKAALNNPEC